MLSQAFILAVVAAVASGLQLEIPPAPTSEGTVTIRWTPEAGDPNVFSLQLANEIFRDTYAIANNVPTSDREITLELPVLETGAGYTLRAHAVSDINEVYGETPEFSIGATTVTSTSSSTIASSTISSSSVPASSTSTSPVSSTTSTGFGTTVRPSTTLDTETDDAAPAETSEPPNAAGLPVKFAASNGFVAVASILAGIAGAAILAL